MGKKRMQLQKRDSRTAGDHDWRDERIAELERELERLKIHSDVLTGGIVGRYDEHIKQLQLERDQAVAWREMTEQRLIGVQQVSERAAAGEKAIYDEIANTVTADNRWRAYLPAVVRAAEFAGDVAFEAIKHVFEPVQEKMPEDDIVAQTLLTIMRNADHASVWRMARGMRLFLESISDHPALLAADVLDEWRHKNAPPSMGLITLLCEKWDGAPTAKVLSEAFAAVSAYNQRPAGQSQTVYCELNDIPRRTLTRQLGFIAEIEAMAAQLDELAALPDKVLHGE